MCRQRECLAGEKMSNTGALRTADSEVSRAYLIGLVICLSIVVLTLLLPASPVLAGTLLVSRGSIATGSEVIRFDPQNPISSTNPSILATFAGLGIQGALDISGHRFFLDARDFDTSRLIRIDTSKTAENVTETGLATGNPAFSGYQWDAKNQYLIAVRFGVGISGSQVVKIDPNTFQVTNVVQFSETGLGSTALDSDGHLFTSLAGQLLIVDTNTGEIQQTGIRTSWRPCHDEPSPIQFTFHWDKTTNTILGMRAVFECVAERSAPVFPRFAGNELVRLNIANGQSVVIARIVEGGIGSSAFDPEGQRLYARIAGQLFVFDTATGQVIRTGISIGDWHTFQWEPGCPSSACSVAP
jgi:DNA-binding beta-propeller fold protein YncE